MNKKKVIVIGLDGANFESINNWIKEGHLPNMKKIKDQGTYGDVKTLIPPATGPIWTSFVTGKNPGKHGLFDFMQRDENSYNRFPSDSTIIKSEKIWNILDRNNKKSIIVNIPMTYPVEKLNGIMITGMMTPSKSQNYVYPSEFKEELKNITDNYVFFPKEAFSKGNVDKYYNGLIDTLEKRAKVIKYLLQNKEWDLFVGVFTVTDLIQHGLLFTLDENHPLYDKKFALKHSGKILELYEKIDKVLGDILKLKDENTYLMLMSDHGFGPLHYFFNVNSFLVKHGFIKFKRNFISQLKLLMFRSGFTVKNAYVLLQKLRLSSIRHKVGGGQYRGVYQILKKFFISFDDIDWKRTKAYSYSGYGQIHINLKGREPLGAVKKDDFLKIINEIKQALGNLKDPTNLKRTLLKAIYKKEELYHGEYLKNAADIIILPRTLRVEPFAAFDFSSSKVFEKVFGTSGTHRTSGAIFYLFGSGIKENHLINGIEITDLAPTILSLLGMPIPEDIDGKVLKDAYVNKSFFSFIKEKHSSKSKEPETEKDNREEVMNRLRSLGYI